MESTRAEEHAHLTPLFSPKKKAAVGIEDEKGRLLQGQVLQK